MRHQLVEAVAEAQNESQHHDHHRRDELVHLVAVQRDAHDERDQRGQHETVERGLVHRGEVDAAENHAEQADDEQRLVADVARHEQHRRRQCPRARRRVADPSADA